MASTGPGKSEVANFDLMQWVSHLEAMLQELRALGVEANLMVGLQEVALSETSTVNVTVEILPGG